MEKPHKEKKMVEEVIAEEEGGEKEREWKWII